MISGAPTSGAIPFFCDLKRSAQASRILTRYAVASSPAIILKAYAGLGRFAYPKMYRRAAGSRNLKIERVLGHPSERRAHQQGPTPSIHVGSCAFSTGGVL